MTDMTRDPKTLPRCAALDEVLLKDSSSGGGQASSAIVKAWWFKQTRSIQQLALQAVISHGPVAVAQVLLGQAREEDVASWKDESGATLLHTAVWSYASNAGAPAWDMAKRVLEAGGGLALNARDGLGRTPLACAAERGNAELVLFLIQVGADPDTAIAQIVTNPANGRKEASYDRLRRSALDVAARGGHEDVVTILLNAGADATLLDFDGLAKPGAGSDGTNVSRSILLSLREARDLRRLGTSQRLRAVDFNQDTGDTVLTVPASIRKLNAKTQAMALASLRDGLVQEIHSLGQATAAEMDDISPEGHAPSPVRGGPR